MRATVDVHFALPFPHPNATKAVRRMTYGACLPCYRRLRHLQAEACCEIVAVEPVQ